MIILKLLVVCVGVLSTSASGPHTPNNGKHSIETGDLLSKFHQNDYKVKFERVELISYKKEYLKHFRIVTFKYNRTCAVINVTWTFAIDVGYNYNLLLQMYRFASNEYRLFPVRLELNFCEAIKANVAGIEGITHCGNFTGCPFIKVRLKILSLSQETLNFVTDFLIILQEKIMHICHWQPDPARLPPFMPDGQYMIEIQGLFGSEEMYIARAYSTVYRPIVNFK
ncbi:hypothetical protein ILUMI_21079 [Ignelater luminosus]|uniref:Uncharacterized protein n=1 Tax=Ignelater luminosus TaxID=2038154 RepID=A0A8K0G3X8_IGNLU|nr:hypothetical protein ILUMI_21079 [Ignelater luminosus]